MFRLQVGGFILVLLSEICHKFCRIYLGLAQFLFQLRHATAEGICVRV